MGWRLAPGVSYCVASGDVIFLDLARDRYFQLPSSVTEPFRLWSGGADRLSAAVAEILAAQGLLVAHRGATQVTASAAPVPTTAMGPTPGSMLQTLRCVVPVLASYRRARQALRHDGLAGALDRLGQTGDTNPEATALAAQFCATAHRLRQDSNCLTRSLALRLYLERRRSSAALVFGVTSRPFKAHCWVQSGSTILNDALDPVLPFTPILVR